MMDSFFKKASLSFISFLKKITSLKIFFFSLLWLIVLIIIGTVAQKDIGLYEAQRIYFSSWIIWIWGVIPMPGCQLILGICFIGLYDQLFFQTSFKIKNIGITIAHLGAMLLLFGSMITGYFSVDGKMMIKEGERVDYFQSYDELEIALVDVKDLMNENVFYSSHEFPRTGEILRSEKIPFQIEVLHFYRNSTYEGRLKEIPFDREDNEDVSGMVFKIRNSENTGGYSIYEEMPSKLRIIVSGKEYFIEIRHKRHQLPFEIELIDFKKTDYASTSMAKSYVSEVYLFDTSIKQRAIIQMNEPLRYKGYTLYQSSFIQEDGHEISIFSVVHNMGRLFPYISSLLMCIGIVIHLLIRSKLFEKKLKKIMSVHD